MKVFKIVLSLGLFTATSVSLGDTVPNGGDYLRILFVKGRNIGSSMVASIDQESVPNDVEQSVRDFIQQRRMDLSSDVLRSSHVWTEDVSQTTCAKTNLVAEAPVILSWNRCNDESVFPLGAAQILIHESVHHLGISSEDFADKVADAIYRTWVLQRKVGDLGFRFDQGTGKCRNETNEVGYNNEFWGECGSFMGLDLSYQENKSNAMRGSDFSFTVGSNVHLRSVALFNSSFEGARLHNSKIQYANLSYSNLRLLQFINNYEGSSIRSSFFIHSNLSGAYLRANIDSSDFSYANMRGAIIEDMLEIHSSVYNPVNNNFSFADLRDADLSKSNIRFDVAERNNKITGALFNDNSKLGISRDEALKLGMIYQP